MFDCQAPEVLLSGPAGTGKSRAALEKMLLVLSSNPGAKGLIVRKWASTLTSAALATWRKFVAVEALAGGKIAWYGGGGAEPPQYKFSNGSSLVVGGMDKATKIMSSEYDLVFVQEAIELVEAEWELITTRLRNGVVGFQQLMGDTNPDAPTHWLKQRCDRGQTVMLHSRHEDNPTLFDDDGTTTPGGAEYLGRLDALTGVRLQRLRHGKWVAAEGVVWPEWDHRVHVVPRFPVPDDWERVWVIDFGFSNPFVCQHWAVDGDGGAVLYREWYRAGMLVEDHARVLLGLVTDDDGSWVEPSPVAIVCDHDAEDRATLRRHLGLGTVPASKNVTDGIQRVAELLRVKPNGRPGLRIMADALVEVDQGLRDQGLPTCTIEEFPAYVFPPPGGKAADERPVKRQDHGVDCVRYLAMWLARRHGSRVRWLD